METLSILLVSIIFNNQDIFFIKTETLDISVIFISEVDLVITVFIQSNKSCEYIHCFVQQNVFNKSAKKVLSCLNIQGVEM